MTALVPFLIAVMVLAILICLLAQSLLDAADRQRRLHADLMACQAQAAGYKAERDAWAENSVLLAQALSRRQARSYTLEELEGLS